ncbi:efflux transporter outer membrane subunit [Variovorax saccharolyticus]|uniref:efflux transporter outer membrane subunit n=1 Tax=Variovorax saccharolyticus TaxID=3053516 RepID=UPI002575D704|nr:efflux transporter outer membrane subunit [Variovorax sp. J31P216]MDM0028083.1 efflux transporter outer membrane subunit [Variovorax sp. J31P216]
MLRILTIPLLLALAACAAAPAVPEPAPALPVHTAWWNAFGSADLRARVEEAQAQNLDVAAAGARLQQAEALVRGADANLWPSVSLAVGASREGRWSGEAPVAGNAHAATLVTRYEVDLWGGQRGLRESAKADLRASTFDRDAVRLAVGAGAASAWLRTVGLRDRVAIAELNLADAERLLGLVEARQRAGAATPLELAQQRGIVATQRRVLLALQREAADSRVLLAVWLGRQAATPPVAGTLDELRVPPFDAGLPSDLLARRPDVARAEARLAAADADIEVARAAMLPSLSLSAGIATGGGRWRDLFESPLYTLAAGLAAPIFDAGKLAAGRDLAVARREELLAGYRSSIVAAFADAQAALQALASLDAERVAQAEVQKQARQALAIAESRYRAGAETLLTLLDAQRTLYAALDAGSQLQLARLEASVGLYKALGGGWGLGAATL